MAETRKKKVIIDIERKNHQDKTRIRNCDDLSDFEIYGMLFTALNMVERRLRSYAPPIQKKEGDKSYLG